jgi:hypothetical protein
VHGTVQGAEASEPALSPVVAVGAQDLSVRRRLSFLPPPTTRSRNRPAVMVARTRKRPCSRNAGRQGQWRDFEAPRYRHSGGDQAWIGCSTRFRRADRGELAERQCTIGGCQASADFQPARSLNDTQSRLHHPSRRHRRGSRLLFRLFRYHALRCEKQTGD